MSKKATKEIKPQELTDEEKCLSEVMVILDKYKCQLLVDFRKTKVMDQDVLAYGIKIAKR
jgi:hypothetical protein